MKAIVFGGSGFLGSHVADSLTEGGYKVKIFDIVPSKYLKGDQEMIVGDMMNVEQVVNAAKDADYVYNFAGMADIDEANKKPLITATLNVIGTIHTLEAAKLTKAKRYVFASTVYVYSQKGSFYRASKQSAERFVEAYKESYNLDYTILRYGSLYGKRADKRNGIYRLLMQALKNKHISYPGKGDELREYIHVEDAAKASVRILDNEYANQHIVITGDEKMRVKDLLMMISEILNSEVKYEFVGKEMDGHYTITPYSFNPKIGKKLLNTYHIDMGQGLIDCLAELHQQLVVEMHPESDWLLIDTENEKIQKQP